MIRPADDDQTTELSGGTGNTGARRRALRDDEMVRLVWEFLGAGTETVVACVEWTLARLVAHPKVQKKLHRELSGGGGGGGDQPVVPSEERLQDLPYLRAIKLESLRLHPPVPFILRDVVGLPEIAAAAVAAVEKAVPLSPPDGTSVRFVFMAEDVGRDPKAWADPKSSGRSGSSTAARAREREPYSRAQGDQMMPFGAGRRHCRGAGLAVIQAKGFVAALVREFEWAPPADGDGVDHTSTNALFLKVMASPLRARIVPRRS